MIADWPETDDARQDAGIEARFAIFQEILSALREARSRQNIPPKTPLTFRVRCQPPSADQLAPMKPYFESMAGARATAWGVDVKAPATGASFVVSIGEVFVDLADHIDLGAEMERKTKELAKLDQSIAGKERQLSNPQFVERAPADVIAKERGALEQLKDLHRVTLAALEALRTSKK